MRRGARVLVALLCLAGVAPAGCAEPETELLPPGHLGVMKLPSADSLVRAASGRLVESGTGEFTETLTARSGNAQLVRTTTGRFDLESARAQTTTRFTASGPDAAAILLGRPADLNSLATEQVRDGSVLYLTKPSWPAAEPGRWVRYEGQWLGGLGRQWSDAVNPPWEPDYDLADPAPTPLLSLPQKMSGPGRYLDGTAEVGRYQISVPLSEARPVIGAAALLGTDTAPAQGQAGPGEEIPVQVEVARDGTLARVILDATRLVGQILRPAAGGPPAAPAQYRYELTLRRLGQPVDIALPAAGAQRAGGIWVQDLRAGTCLAADPMPRRHSYFLPVGCERPHRYEVYARVPLGGEADPYPGRRALEVLARQRCGEQLRTFAGAAAGSAARFWAVPPGEGPWLQGSRLTPCVLDAGRDVSASLRGSAG